MQAGRGCRVEARGGRATGREGNAAGQPARPRPRAGDTEQRRVVPCFIVVAGGERQGGWVAGRRRRLGHFTVAALRLRLYPSPFGLFCATRTSVWPLRHSAERESR